MTDETNLVTTVPAVLLVDNDEGVREIIPRVVERLNLTVTLVTVKTLSAALAELQNREFAGIVVAGLIAWDVLDLSVIENRLEKLMFDMRIRDALNVVRFLLLDEVAALRQRGGWILGASNLPEISKQLLAYGLVTDIVKEDVPGVPKLRVPALIKLLLEAGAGATLRSELAQPDPDSFLEMPE